MQEWAVFLLIGLVAGWAAAKLLGDSSPGAIGSLVVGVIGAILGGYLFGRFGIVIQGVPRLISSFISALAGSVILLLVLRFVKKV